MIRQVILRRFKRFSEVTFEFPGHLILAGPNNTGKTTLLQAIAAWHFAFKRWKESGATNINNGAYRRKEIGKADFTAVPVRALDLIWNDRRHADPIEIEVVHRDGWRVGMEFVWDSPEQMKVRPTSTTTEADVESADIKPVFIPATSGVSRDEPFYVRDEYLDLVIGQAEPGEILRNILVRAHNAGESWQKLTALVHDLFGYELLPPAVGAYITADYRPRPGAPTYDIASAGSGFQQVLTVFGYLFARPGSILLIDEPDAHLHVILQELIWSRLRRLAAETRSQLILATHAEVFINAVDPEELCLCFERPRLLRDVAERSRLTAALRSLSNVDLMVAQTAPGVLYTEDWTDLEILRAWARVLNHPISARLEHRSLEHGIMWKPKVLELRGGAAGIPARDHYEALRLVREDLPGFELVDGDAHPNIQSQPITGAGFQRQRWRRYEIESYLFHPASLERYVIHLLGMDENPAAANANLDALRAWVNDNLPPAVLRDPLGEHPFLNATKARTEILPPLLAAAGFPGLPYTRYAEIAALMRPEEIHPEVREKLDAIQKAFAPVSSYEVPEPIINSPFDEPQQHWHIEEGKDAELRAGRRPAMYFYRDPKAKPERNQQGNVGIAIELKLVNRIRERVAAWRTQGYPGVTRTTHELLHWWRREGREKRLFFAQLEAVETIVFLTEARGDFKQGIEIPRDDPSEDRKADGFDGFLRYGCKMATGSGKTTVMGMLAAWSILNKVNDRSDGRFSDVVLIVCPNVTIRDRLQELDPERGEASLYRTRDLVPGHLMSLLTQGRVLVTNWHVFEPHAVQTGGVSSKVTKAGVVVRTKETINIGPKTTTARGTRYLTQEDFGKQIAAGMLTVIEEKRDKQGNLEKVFVESVRYVESDTSLINRVLGREVGGKQNILVMNDEAHHAYRIKRDAAEEEEEEIFGEEEEAEEFFKEATVWIEGLDRIQKLRGINFCVDLSATPYFLGRVGQATNRPFPWVVSDFGLIDAIESGLVKIPQLAVRDTTGAAIPGYFNIWHWVLPQLTPAERGGKRANPKPEAILKYAHHPIAMLGALWDATREEWTKRGTDPRPPVFILVCKNTQLANVVYGWLANNEAPTGIPPVKIEGFHNNGQTNTIIVHSRVVHETDAGHAQGDQTRWMRFTLDTVGKTTWPADSIGRPIYPEGFEDLAKKLDKPLHPPGRDVRCIVSVGMLTEGWDCSTVTHIIGLRPFMSQLLCEQVVGRGLRRADYNDFDEQGRLREEVAKVFGVPFEVIPFKANKQAAPPPPVKRFHVHALPNRAHMEIKFPRLEGYTQAIRNRVTADWNRMPPLTLEPGRIPPEVEMKGLNVNNRGRPSLSGPGKLDQVSLEEFRSKRRLQELTFDLARDLTRDYKAQPHCSVPSHVLFPQLADIVQRYLAEKVRVQRPADVKDLFLAPYYGWVVERLVENIHGDVSQGESPEVPRYESTRGPGSTADVDFWTSRDVREVNRSHLNYAVADTKRWEQSAAYYIDTHKAVRSFVKNSGLGFAIPYLHNGQMHDYLPDFIIRLNAEDGFLILETKGYDPLEEIKAAAAQRWVTAVNNDGKFGRWNYKLVKQPAEIPSVLSASAR